MIIASKIQSTFQYAVSEQLITSVWAIQYLSVQSSRYGSNWDSNLFSPSDPFVFAGLRLVESLQAAPPQESNWPAQWLLTDALH